MEKVADDAGPIPARIRYLSTGRMGVSGIDCTNSGRFLACRSRACCIKSSDAAGSYNAQAGQRIDRDSAPISALAGILYLQANRDAIAACRRIRPRYKTWLFRIETEARIAAVEKNLYRQMRQLEDRHWWFLGRRRIIRTIIERLRPGQNLTILDVGCGTGGNLSMLADFGIVVGSEFDPESAAIAAERCIAEIVRSGLPKHMPFADEQFQLVTLLDVLEHIDEDQASLATLANLLQPGGHLVVTVPAFQFLWGQHDVEHHHRRRYRAGQLRQRLEASGLQVQWLSYYNSLLFPLVVLLRLVRRAIPAHAQGSGEGRELALPPPAINRLLELLFASERRWLGRLYVPFGVSLVAVARKP